MSKAKILVADDEPDIVESLDFCLALEGYEVVTAADGEAALSAESKESPQVVILDVMMPKENGYRVSRAIKERHAAKGDASPAVLLLTARNLQADQEREKMFMEFSGADAVMYKPFEMEQLLERVRLLLERFSAQAVPR